MLENPETIIGGDWINTCFGESTLDWLNDKTDPCDVSDTHYSSASNQKDWSAPSASSYGN